MSPLLTPNSPPLSSTSSTFGVRASLYKTVTAMKTPDDNFSETELAWARDLMSEHCTNKSRKSKGEFSYKDANAVLASIADGKVPNATPALVKALQTNFQANASIERRKSTNLFKVIIGRDQEDIRSNVLERAVQNCSYDIVYVLALQADQDALDRALPFAIKQNDWKKVSILMAKRANAAPLCTDFLRIVDNDPEELLPLLLEERIGACQGCRNKGLVQASTSGILSRVQMLINAGAHTTYDNAAALKAAIAGSHEDAAIAIASSNDLKSHPLLLDTMVGEAFAAGQNGALIACLQSGAKGPVTNEVLLEAVKQRRPVELIDTLVQHGASVEHKDGAVVHAAIQSRSLPLLQAVLRGKPTKVILSATVDTLASLKSISIIHDMVSALLSTGLEGDPANRLLVISLHAEALVGEMESRFSLVQLLVQQGSTDVNFNGGQPLILAATKGWLGILRVLLSSQVSLPSLQAAVAASIGIADTKVRLGIVERLLHGAAGLDRQILEFSIFQIACKNLDLPLLQLLPHTCRSSEDVLVGFRAALSNPRWLKPVGLSTVRALLHLGASGAEVNHAFCQAAKNYERDAFELFAPYVDLGTIVDALGAIIQSSKDWLALDNKYLWLIHHLLEWGAKGREQANHTLLIAIEEYVMKRCSDALVETILSVGHADVNFQSGKALKLAVWAGNVEVFRMLLSRGASMETVESVFFEVMVAPLSEESALSFIDILTLADGPSSVKGFKKIIPRLRAPVRGCLTAHPDSVKLVKRLIKLGVNFDVEEPTVLYGDGCGPELCTTLLWSLLPPQQGRRPIEPGVIQLLIEAKVNVNFVAPRSKATAVILAANFGHTDTVNHLIKAEANTRMRDHFKCSALFYASQNGHLNVVKSLLKAQYTPNDGSLHEAARNLHSKICALLIKTRDFDVNFHSSRHQGRTALQEMAYCCDGTRSPVEMEETFDALGCEKGGLKPFEVHQSTGKHALLFALENLQPFSVTQALLDTLLWRDINSDQNVFTQKEISPTTGNLIDCHYSPTMYLKNILPAQSEKDVQRNYALARLLSDKGAVDRYWSDTPRDQPPGAMGYPEAIAKEVKRWNKVRQDHEEQLRREEETQNQKFFFEQARHEQRLLQESQTAMQKVQSSALIHENKLHQDAEVTLQQHQAIEEKNRLAHEGRVMANQDRAAQVAVDNQGLAQKHHILEHHQQVTDYHKLRQKQMMDYQTLRQNQMADHQKYITQVRTDQQKLGSQQALDHQKQLAHKTLEKQKLKTSEAVDKHNLKALEAMDKHKYNHLHKMDSEKREHEKKMGQQQVIQKKSLAKLASQEDQRKLQVRYDTAQINLFEQMAKKEIAGPANPAQGKVVKKQGPRGYIEDGRLG
ncbi:hypothetical protein B0T21DRAFT_411986 [Apiosordaria backusii]|uniref:Uncharacterized protein n=1 Tax=Apiosordaria backusii TaxID=314023 RepID=A0AA40ECW2_9PEZI|nr:hypothetical protein B0T21DRAFT_411986 [Apiosordaria backusii]